MGTNILVDNELAINNKDLQRHKVKNSDKDKTGSTRTVPLNIRLKVLDRDAYRCILCGRSPAMDIGVRLHIDHKIPFSKGGKSTIDNLQTLCQDCNLGKSDEFIGVIKP
jgi:5-methylcytosine-specific restriction endonuclease McrA